MEDRGGSAMTKQIYRGGGSEEVPGKWTKREANTKEQRGLEEAG